MLLPSIRTYGNYSSDNYGAHCLRVDVGPLTVWYSYQTPIAFRVDGHDLVIRHNDWSTTTGKHLNLINPDHSVRVSSDKFEELWDKQVSKVLRSK